MRKMRRWAYTAVLLLVGMSTSLALSPEKLYLLHCMGCHGPKGEGIPGRVPTLRGFVGYFVYIPEGRAFLIQVPGAANSPLSDAELAEVTNWILRAFSSEQLPKDFRPYSPEEVARLRRTPLLEVSPVREAILRKLRDMGIIKP